MPQKPEVVVAGLLCLDIIPSLLSSDTSALLLPAHVTEAGPLTLALGGVVANTGLALYKLGITPRLIGKIGADTTGEIIRQLFKAYAPDLPDNLLVSPGDNTSYSIVLNPPGSDRAFLHNPGCNSSFTAQDIDIESLAEVRLFHFGYPPLMQRLYRDEGKELIELFKRVKATGVTTALDMAMPDMSGSAGQVNWKRLLEQLLPYVDIFLPGLEEMLVLFRETEKLAEGATPEVVGALAAQLLEMGAKMVGLKAGERGMYLRTAGTEKLAGLGRAAPLDLTLWANRELWSPCFATQVVGTTGSGDSTIAGFFLGLLHEMSPEEALRTACATGACNVEAADALSGVRSWSEIKARLSAGWSQLELNFESPGWLRNTASGIWYGPYDKLNQG
ncbi:MAG: carbohydrate kinase family protein [Chloroflexi bacterium]|uniref:Carbohydrate kinase family protein n=1 Tax=Candidatus Chlorohelix allophototropha TaxID=3003348 RepID=A0A8T7M599_9CHLR|nr:carbohydrate kinase family protein [Chloroflexota bacterium]WJW69215.1 carbohydrate kinase family protein [Chloroflexota bacterium L227-S17]